MQCSSAEFSPALAMMVQHSGHPDIAKCSTDQTTTTQLSSTAKFFHDFIHQALTLLAGSYLQLSLHIPLALPLHVHLTLPSFCFVVCLCVCSGFVPEICLFKLWMSTVALHYSVIMCMCVYVYVYEDPVLLKVWERQS